MRSLNFQIRARSGPSEKTLSARKLTNKISLKRIRYRTGSANLKMNSFANKSKMIKNTSYSWNRYKLYSQHTSRSYSISNQMPAKLPKSSPNNYKTKRHRLVKQQRKLLAKRPRCVNWKHLKTLLNSNLNRKSTRSLAYKTRRLVRQMNRSYSCRAKFKDLMSRLNKRGPRWRIWESKAWMSHLSWTNRARRLKRN